MWIWKTYWKTVCSDVAGCVLLFYMNGSCEFLVYINATAFANKENCGQMNAMQSLTN